MSKEKTFLASEGILVTDKDGNEYLLFPVNQPLIHYNTQAEKLLLDFGFSCTLSGFKYILTAVELIKEHPNYAHSFCANLYPQIAKKYNVKPCTIEREIRYLLTSSKKSKKYKEVFGDTSSMTNKRFIVSLMNLLN